MKKPIEVLGESSDLPAPYTNTNIYVPMVFNGSEMVCRGAYRIVVLISISVVP